MVKLSDFISFLKDVSAYDKYVETVKTCGIPSLRAEMFEGTDEEMLEIFWRKATSILPASEIIKASFSWKDTEDETQWVVLDLLWKAKCEVLTENRDLDLVLENIKNYFREKGLLEDVLNYQRNSMRDHRDRLPENITLEKLHEEVIKFRPKAFLSGTFEFDKTKDPDKWRKINAEFEDWVDRVL